MAAVHFHSSDERFCGTRQQLRQFTFDPNAVSCPRCQERDRFELSEQAAAYVTSLSA
jgi:hypothetical protein